MGTYIKAIFSHKPLTETRLCDKGYISKWNFEKRPGGKRLYMVNGKWYNEADLLSYELILYTGEIYDIPHDDIPNIIKDLNMDVIKWCKEGVEVDKNLFTYQTSGRENIARFIKN